MRSQLLVFAAVLVSAAVAPAGPLPWSYYVRVNAPEGYDGILFGTEVKPPVTDNGPDVSYSHIWDTYQGNYGMVRIHFETATGTETLFTFSSGFEQSVTTLPAGKTFSPGKFALSWGFQAEPEYSSGSTGGTISADGLFTSGTGNYVIGLDHTETVRLGERTAVVQFVGVNTESGARIDMTVTEIEDQPPPPTVPEPCTLVLGGIALAGGLAAWQKRRAG